MNSTEFAYLLNKPKGIATDHIIELDRILDEFPFLQSARAIRLKGLYDQNSFKYNHELKITAAHTTDRAVLFDFITSEDFLTISPVSDQITPSISEPIEDNVPVAPKKDTLEQSILRSIEEATPTDIPFDQSHIESDLIENLQATFKTNSFSPTELNDILVEKRAQEVDLNFIPVEQSAIDKENEDHIRVVYESNTSLEPQEKLEIGTPLDFSSHEKHSFQEWLQLAKVEPIDRSIPNTNTSSEETVIKSTSQIKESTDIDEYKRKKAQIIDKFIENNPKILPIKSYTPPIVVPFELNKEENTYLMTETLARVYLEQKKYTKAIQAYEILILKYPEKITFFADRIAEIKILQQNNNNN